MKRIGMTLWMLMLCSTWMIAQAQTAQKWIDKAREGDTRAYEKLTEMYHEGKEVKHDFLMILQMGMYAEHYGGRSVELFFQTLPEDDPDRITFEVMNIVDAASFEGIETKIDRVRQHDLGMALFLDAQLAKTRDHNSKEYQRLLEKASRQGCSLATFMIAMESFTLENVRKEEAKYSAMAVEIPIFYNNLGAMHLMSDQAPELFNIKRAIECFKEADKKALLSPDNAQRLIYCYEILEQEGEPACDKQEMQRLQKLVNKK